MELGIICQSCLTFLAAILLTVLLISRGNRFLTYNGKFWSYYFVFSLEAIVAIPFMIFHQPHEKNSWCARYVNAAVCFVSSVIGITWELRNKEILAEERGCVVMINHQNSLDQLGLTVKWLELGKWCGVMRKEFFYFWPYGLAAWLVNTVFIDRHNSDKAKEQLKTAGEKVRDKWKLVYFPEGTRNHDGDSLLPFKKGGFHVAITCQVPIIPIVYSPYHFISHRRKIFGTGRVIMKVLSPISTEGLTASDVNDLMERTRNIMLETYIELSKEVQNDIKT